jgi:hypothetical protein
MLISLMPRDDTFVTISEFVGVGFYLGFPLEGFNIFVRVVSQTRNEYLSRAPLPPKNGNQQLRGGFFPEKQDFGHVPIMLPPKIDHWNE